MALLEIKKYPEKVLSEKAESVEVFDSGLQKLIDDMIETMYAAPGIGLAANQVGVLKQVLIIDISGSDEKTPLIVLVNPVIISSEGEIQAEEGCLSVPGYLTVLKRAEKVKVRGLDRDGKPVEVEGEDLLSRVLQHEIDHLNGILLIERVGRLKRELFKKRFTREKTLNK